jgi:hypothetical protein
MVTLMGFMAPSSLWHPALCAMAALSASPGSAIGAASLWDDDPIFGLRGNIVPSGSLFLRIMLRMGGANYFSRKCDSKIPKFPHTFF